MMPDHVITFQHAFLGTRYVCRPAVSGYAWSRYHECGPVMTGTISFAEMLRAIETARTDLFLQVFFGSGVSVWEG